MVVLLAEAQAICSRALTQFRRFVLCCFARLLPGPGWFPCKNQLESPRYVYTLCSTPFKHCDAYFHRSPHYFPPQLNTVALPTLHLSSFVIVFRQLSVCVTLAFSSRFCENLLCKGLWPRLGVRCSFWHNDRRFTLRLTLWFQQHN